MTEQARKLVGRMVEVILSANMNRFGPYKLLSVVEDPEDKGWSVLELEGKERNYNIPYNAVTALIEMKDNDD